MITSPTSRRISWTRPVGALLLALGLGSMCTVVATTMSMPMPGNGAVVLSTTTASGDSATPMAADDQPCGTCDSVECAAVAVTFGLALSGLLLMLMRRRSSVVVMRRSLITARRTTWRPPRIRLAPIRFQLCIMRT